MAKKNKCATCRFGWRAGSDGYIMCNYLTVFGHTRGCDPGDGCVRYVKGTRLVQPPESRGYGALLNWQQKNREQFKDVAP